MTLLELNGRILRKIDRTEETGTYQVRLQDHVDTSQRRSECPSHAPF